MTTLSGVNTYTGGTTLRAGTLTAATSAAALGTGAFTLGDTTGSAAATLRASTTSLTYANSIVLATGTTGTLSLGVTGTAISTTFSGGVTGTNNLNFLAAATTGTITMSGLINNTGTVTNTSTGTGAVIISNAAGLGTNVTSLIQNSTTSALTLSGVPTANSTYAGSVLVRAGQLNVNAGAAFGLLGTGAITIGDTTGANNATLNYGSAFTTTEAPSSITIAAGTTGVLTISNTSANSRTIGGNIAINNTTNATATNLAGLTFSTTAAGSNTFTGAISGSGGVNVNNTSTGVTVFNGAGTYSGGTNILAGTLRSNNATTPFGSGAITLGATTGTLAATLQTNTSATIANAITVQAGSSGVKTINSSNNSATTWSGLITANDNLTISNGGTGTWAVSNTGNTLAAAKTLTVNDTSTAAVNLVAWSTGAGSNITFNATNTGSIALNGVISGGASVTTIGGNSTGSINFTQQNTYTGGTTFSTATGSAAVPTVDSTGAPGSITSGPFGTGTLTFSGGSIRGGTAADRTIGNAITAAGNMTFVTVAAEKTLNFTAPVTLTGNRSFATNVGVTVVGKSVTFSGAIGDGGSAFGVTQTGTGNLVLSGANTYTGNTAATSGLLVVTGSVANGSGLSIAPTAAAGGTVSFINNAANTPTNFGTVSLGSATGPAIIGLDLGTASDIIAASGVATVTNNIGFAINGAAGFGAGNYNLITATSGLTSSTPTYAISRAPGGFSYGFTNTDSQVQLNVAAAAASTLYWRGQINNSLSAFSAGNTNWATDAAGTTPANYTPGVNQTAVFSATSAATATTATLDQNFTLGDLQFIAAPTGVTAVTLNPGTTPGGTASTLTLTPSVSTAGISVASAAGAVTIAAPIVLGAAQTWSVDGTAPSSLTVSSAITGAGGNTLNITGGAGLLGVVSLTAAAGQNTYSGDTVIGNGGILQGTVAANLSQNSAMTVNGTGILRVNGIANTIPSLSGTGFVENNSAATAVALTINNAGTSDFGGTIRNGGAAALNIVKSGTGTQTFSGTYNYTGTTAVNAGILRFSGTDTAAAANTITVNTGGTVQFGATNPLNAVTNLNLAGTGTLDLNGFSGTIAGHTSAATNIITNNSASTAVSSATTAGTPSGAGVYVDALTIATQAQTVTAIVQDGATRKTQLVVNNNNTSTLISTNTANTFSGGLVLANNLSGTRLGIAAPITGTPFGTGPIIIGQTNTDKAGIIFSGTANGLSNPIVVNTSLGTDRFGIRSDVAGVTLSGLITANSDAVFYSNSTTGGLNVTGQVTGASGLVLDISQTTTANTVLNVTLNNTGTANDYAGDTVVGRTNGTPTVNYASTLTLGAANQIPNGAGKGNVTVSIPRVMRFCEK